MDRPHKPASLTSWVTDYVSQKGLRAHVQVMRAEQRVFILVTVTQPTPPDLFGSNGAKPSLAEALLKALRPRLDPQVTLGGLHWSWTRAEVAPQTEQALAATRTRLHQKIRALRLSRTDLGFDVHSDGDTLTDQLLD